MQKIIPTIKPDTTGKEVANLQECLLLLLDKNIFKAYQPPNRPMKEELKQYWEMLKKETGASFFGEGTQQLVFFFQIQQGLGDGLKGVVEEITAAKLNEFLKELEALEDLKMYSVSGRVTNALGEALVGKNVIAYDKDHVQATSLGSAETNVDGFYEITYDPAQFKTEGKTVVDLAVKAYDTAGNTISTSSIIMADKLQAVETVNLKVKDKNPNPKTVLGKVTDANSRPMANLKVEIHDASCLNVINFQLIPLYI